MKTAKIKYLLINSSSSLFFISLSKTQCLLKLVGCKQVTHISLCIDGQRGIDLQKLPPICLRKRYQVPLPPCTRAFLCPPLKNKCINYVHNSCMQGSLCALFISKEQWMPSSGITCKKIAHIPSLHQVKDKGFDLNLTHTRMLDCTLAHQAS